MMWFIQEAAAQEGHGAPAHEGAAPAGEAHEGAAEGGHHEGMDWHLVGLQATNFLIFFTVLFFAVRRPISDALGNRANAVRRDLDESARVKDEADRRYHQIEDQLAGLDRRIDELKAEAANEADLEAQRIRERAEIDAVRIQQTAERTIREEAIRARQEIRKEVVEQAAVLAREIVKQSVTREDQARLQAEFLGVIRKPMGGEA